jgi:hypothetical protein
MRFAHTILLAERAQSCTFFSLNNKLDRYYGTQKSSLDEAKKVSLSNEAGHVCLTTFLNGEVAKHALNR